MRMLLRSVALPLTIKISMDAMRAGTIILTLALAPFQPFVKPLPGPSLLTCSLPRPSLPQAPSMLASNADGPTLNSVFYFAVTESTVQVNPSVDPLIIVGPLSVGSAQHARPSAAFHQALRASEEGADIPPAVDLLRRFCTTAEEEATMFGRFKCIGMLRNYEETGMPSIMKGYNGKPVLIRNKHAVKGTSAVGALLQEQPPPARLCRLSVPWHPSISLSLDLSAIPAFRPPTGQIVDLLR